MCVEPKDVTKIVDSRIKELEVVLNSKMQDCNKETSDLVAKGFSQLKENLDYRFKLIQSSVNAQGREHTMALNNLTEQHKIMNSKVAKHEKRIGDLEVFEQKSEHDHQDYSRIGNCPHSPFLKEIRAYMITEQAKQEVLAQASEQALKDQAVVNSTISAQQSKIQNMINKKNLRRTSIGVGIAAISFLFARFWDNFIAGIIRMMTFGEP